MQDYWNNPPEDDLEAFCPECGEVADVIAQGPDGYECQCSACGHEFHFVPEATPFDDEPPACLGVDEE